MQTNTQATAAKPPIPQHVLERLESEWRQMRDGAQQPAATSPR